MFSALKLFDLEGYITHLGCVSQLTSQSIPSLTTYSPPPAKSCLEARLCPHKLSWGGGGGAGFDGSGEVGKILHTGLIRTLNRFFSIHIEYETGIDTVALTTKTFMHLSFLKNFLSTECQLIITSNC